ncbi:hypothetical protein [Streptomyces acidicola]|uniref:hypothetical protein n=1 Tax=Streptomyces acidicola TaxID=2596892 RepID=UPI003442C083
MPVTLTCPLPRCRLENAGDAEVCTGCGIPLQGYARLRGHPARLFNRGLAEARGDRLTVARDCFAAVVHWCPDDTEARNALALASSQLNDVDEARRQWKLVLEQRPRDPKAIRGLSLLGPGPG